MPLIAIVIDIELGGLSFELAMKMAAEVDRTTATSLDHQPPQPGPG